MGSRIETGLRRSLIAVAVEMVVCGTAFAQVQAPAQPQAQAEPEAPVVVVTGARAALAKSLELKRNAAM
jgi:iron complex outermembrane receptor protein